MRLEPISDEQLIESLRQDILEQADQIGGLVSELEQLRDVYTATAELLQIREEQVQQLLKDVSDSQQQLAETQKELANTRDALVEQREITAGWQDAAAMNQVLINLRRAETAEQQLAASQAEVVALTQLVNGFTRREDALRGTLTDDDILVYLADVELPRPAAEHIAEFSVMVFREGMARDALATPSAAAEGDGSIFDLPKPGRRSHGKVVSVTDRPPLVIEGEPSAAAERVQALEQFRRIVEREIFSNLASEDTWIQIGKRGLNAIRVALAALDAATGEETATVEDVPDAD